MNAITIQHLTKDYGQGKGVFDVTLSIKKGEVYGYLGPNGAGKSTTMRHLMGFSKPQTGTVHIQGMDCWTEQKMKDFSYAEKLSAFFEIDPNTGMKRMSKGMKQKIGIIAAFMHDPDILLLDEPTSGLDPLMQNRFIELVEREKRNGKTIILSSHIFDEVEKTCDRIGMIRRGQLIQEVTVDELRHSQFKTYKIQLSDTLSFEKLKQAYPNAEYREQKNQVILSINDREINQLIAVLSTCHITFLSEEKHTLEKYFMKFYGGNEND